MSADQKAFFRAGDAIARNDTKTALRIYKDLASRGDFFGTHCLGWCYEQGIGVEVDYGEAFRLWSLAAAQGVPESAFGLGTCLEAGRGVEQDLFSAYCWYRVAQDLGYPDALPKVAQLGEQLTAEQLSAADEMLGNRSA
jgi:TPR repeat protein